MLQRAGLRDTAFIAMSNYYYDEKNEYLRVLADVRRASHDLTAFLQFALRGVEHQSKRLLVEIQREISKALYRTLMYDLFNRLRTPRKRVIAERQIAMLKVLLDTDALEFSSLVQRTIARYSGLKNSMKALIRDVNHLMALKMIVVEKTGEGTFMVKARLEWPMEVTETEFFQQLKNMPSAKTGTFLQ